MDASRGTAGQRAGSRLTSSASTMEFSSNTGTFFRTRLRKRNPRAVYLCSETVSPSDAGANSSPIRSEEHTSELQSLAYLVCRLLLEKKKIHRSPRRIN